jgi:Putative transmembrane protein (PGPGW)
MSSASRTDPEEGREAPADGPAAALGGEVPAPPGSLRARMRANPATRQVWRVGVFVVGLLCIALGVTLVVLPGPLTIPPVVLGLWIWSTEFVWAQRFFAPAKVKGKAAWEQAKLHPVSSAAVTVGGLVVAGAVVWAVSHFDLVDQGKQLVGLG